MYDGDIASTLVTEDAIRDKIAELAEQIGRGLRATCGTGGRRDRPAARRRAQGRGHVHDRLRPGAADAGAAGVHGGQLLRLGDVVVGCGADPQGPRPRHRRPPRADRRGHHRLGPDAVLAAQEPRVAPPGLAGGVHAAAQAGRGEGRGAGRATSASTSRTSSSSATGWTTPSATATCPSSARSTPPSTPEAPSRPSRSRPSPHPNERHRRALTLLERRRSFGLRRAAAARTARCRGPVPGRPARRGRGRRRAARARSVYSELAGRRRPPCRTGAPSAAPSSSTRAPPDSPGVPGTAWSDRVAAAAVVAEPRACGPAQPDARPDRPAP